MSEKTEIRVGDIWRDQRGDEFEILGLGESGKTWTTKGSSYGAHWWPDTIRAYATLVRRAAPAPTELADDTVLVGDVREWADKWHDRLTILRLVGDEVEAECEGSTHRYPLCVVEFRTRLVSRAEPAAVCVGQIREWNREPNGRRFLVEAFVEDDRCIIAVGKDVAGLKGNVTLATVREQSRVVSEAVAAAPPPAAPSDPRASYWEAARRCPPEYDARGWLAAVQYMMEPDDEIGASLPFRGDPAGLVAHVIETLEMAAYRDSGARAAYDRALASAPRRDRSQAERSKPGRVAVGRFEWSRPR